MIFVSINLMIPDDFIYLHAAFVLVVSKVSQIKQLRRAHLLDFLSSILKANLF